MYQVILYLCVAEMRLLVVPQLDKEVGALGVVLKEWTTEQLNPPQRADFYTGTMANWKLISRKCSISLSSLRKGGLLRAKGSPAGERTWWVMNSGVTWLHQIPQFFLVLDDDHKPAVLFAALAEGEFQWL